MKKFMSLLMAIVMVFTLATPVKAEQTFEITHPGSNDHTYEIYQIFTGDLSSNGKVLSNVKWGVNGTGQTGTPVDTNTLQALKDLSDEKLNSDQTQLATIEQYVTLTNPHKTLTKTEGTVSVVAGYYLIKDVNGSLTNKDDAYTEYIVQIVGDVTISPKSVKPEVDKQVWDEDGDQDINAKVDEEGKKDNWGETADHDINEVFAFKLIATIPADVNLAGYDTYKVVFNDTMSKGVSFDEMVSVKVNGTTIEPTNYVVSPLTTNADETKSFTITIANVKPLVDDLTAGVTIEVIYKAHLTEDAVVGNEDENKNTVYLQYSNNPNASGAGEGNELGKTPEDHVWVFTYEVNGTKVDGAKKDGDKYTTPLKDAEFVFYKGEGTNKEYVVLGTDNKVDGWVKDKAQATVIKTPENGKFAIIGLDAGTYHLEETKAPDGYNLLTSPLDVEISAEHYENENKINATTNISEESDLDITVLNNAGATLPETGGMGTTLFYVFGSLLAVGAIVLLVTKKRMNEE